VVVPFVPEVARAIVATAINVSAQACADGCTPAVIHDCSEDVKDASKAGSTYVMDKSAETSTAIYNFIVRR
jgi:hypothetical protein